MPNRRLAALVALSFACIVWRGVQAQEAAPQLDAAALRNPAVRAAVELPRTKPADFVTSIETLLAFDQAQLATQIADELVALEVSDADRAALVSEVGTARLLALAGDRRLPEGIKAFVETTIKSAGAAATSPERISDLLTRIADTSAPKRDAAVAELAALGQPAVVPLVRLMAQDDTPLVTRGAAQQALVRLGPYSAPALLAVLPSSREALRADAAEVLAAIGTTQAAGLMGVAALQSAGDRPGAAFATLAGEPATDVLVERLLLRELKNALGDVPVFPPVDDRITLYAWDDAAATLTPLELPTHDANLLQAARIARGLTMIRGERTDYRLSAARLALEAMAVSDAADVRQPVLDNYPLSDLEIVLADALKTGHHAAAAAVLNEVAARRDPAALTSTSAEPAPVARALASPSPRVRQAALAAIAAIDPTTAFAGSSRVAEVLTHVLTSHGERLAIAGAPRLDVAATWAGGLAPRGYASGIGSTGQEILDQARGSVDVEMILLDMTLADPDVREVVFQLRRSWATAEVPIALIARESHLSRARMIASEHRRVVAVLRPHTDAALTALADKLVAELPRTWPTPEERQQAAAAAVTNLQKWIEDGRDFYRLRPALAERANLIDPLVGGETSYATLARLGTPGSQRTLVELASRATLPEAQREQAIVALGESVKQYGVLLTTREIERQYELYNQALATEQPSTPLLSKILDVIEGPRRAARAEAIPTPQE